MVLLFFVWLLSWNLNLSNFIEVPVLSQESELTCICVLRVSIYLFLFDYGNVPIAWDFILFFAWWDSILNAHSSSNQLRIWWLQIEFTDDALAGSVSGYLRPLNRQLMPWNLQIQYSYLYCNGIMCIDVYCRIIDKMV